MKRSLLIVIMLASLLMTARAQKESIRLICPLQGATVVPPPDDPIKYDAADICVVLQSKVDSVVKCVGAGTVTNIEYTPESGNGVVLFVNSNKKEYYFWYTGLSKLLVRQNQVVKAGQPLGYVSKGSSLKLIMYEFETQKDPVKFLDCEGIGKQ
jgi:hypothetical protein